jgi:hypothetical protein
VIGLEATGNYHRPLAYYLQQEDFYLHLISSMAAARTQLFMVFLNLIIGVICNDPGIGKAIPIPGIS